MKHRHDFYKVLALLLSFAALSRAQPRMWTLGTSTLKPTKEAPDEFTPSLLHIDFRDATGGPTLEASAEVHMMSIDDYFLSNNKAIVVGESAKWQIVVIFDLLTKREIDRFACYMPRRISDDWIAYVEWYPAHFSGQPTDAVLVYDLALSPLENRLKGPTGAADGEFPPWAPTEVGFPIYPAFNAQQGSYLNHVADVMEAERILGSPMLLLPSRKLVIAVTEGFDARTYRTHLEVVDLSRGLTNPVSRSIELPAARYPGVRQSPLSMEITRMEAVSPNEVKLYVPESEYGVSSIVVDINR